jgi:hypothetical protein
MFYCDVCGEEASNADRNLTEGGGTVCERCLCKGLHPDLTYQDVAAICKVIELKNEAIPCDTKEEYDVLRRARKMLIEWHQDEVTDFEEADRFAVRMIQETMPECGIMFVDQANASKDPDLLKRAKEMLVAWHEDDEIAKESSPTIYANRMMKEHMPSYQLGFAERL